ncbi:FbpB family small basic protein [Margalitia sp. FSL K6-0131]
MRAKRKLSLEQLIESNKKEIMSNKEYIRNIEERIDNKHQSNMKRE